MCFCDISLFCGHIGDMQMFFKRTLPLSHHTPLTTEPPNHVKDTNLYSYSFPNVKILFAFRRDLDQDAGTFLPLACLMS